ncbi:hypothetical protein GCM10010441_11660 [Kitasatospora paracochleata]|uniref:Histone deacetylase n=1 Tax=Kitasatospora paracochleata TaxID=58354 RepID=A0ABT1JA16_9ACTN|nr:histone deacetylase [Kitasatospora paracochleata]MCP2314300.1 hypothetical protein [Kitasatospora paracochleata]
MDDRPQDADRPAPGRAPFRPEPLGSRAAPPSHVWYAAYGSNMHAARLALYLRGGRAPNGGHVYPGCRDKRLPERSLPVLLPGTLYFALTSHVWGGGMAFHDTAQAGRMPARAYLLTAGQFADLAAQEMHREPYADLDLSTALATGRQRLGPGRYETVVCAGAIDGIPVLGFTAPWDLRDAELNAPSTAYLRVLAAGLAESHGWSAERAAGYLAGRPGAGGHWTPQRLLAALRDAPADR